MNTITHPSSTSSDPRTKRTRAVLQQVLLELLEEKSFLAITVGDIASRAAVNRATFYAHFRDKDDLLEFGMREKCRRVLVPATPQKAPPTPEAWRTLIAAVLNFFARMPIQCPQAARQWNAIVANAMREELEHLLSEWLIPRRMATPEHTVTIAAISGAIVTAGMRWLRGQTDISPEQGAQELTNLIIHGMHLGK